MEEGWMRTGKDMEEGWLRPSKEAGIRQPQRDKRVAGFQRVHGGDMEEGTNSVGGERRTTGRDSAETEKRGMNCPMTGKDLMDELSRLLDMRLTKEQMKGVLKLIRRLLANQPDLNLITSFYQLMSLKGVQHANEYEVHVCNAGKDNNANNKYCPGFTYPKIRRSEWLAHQDDKCDYCETPRFHVNKKKGSPQEITLKPRWSMSLFGWNTVVKNIMERKDVMTWFRRARGVDPPAGSFRASPAWREMQPKLPEVVATSPNTAHFMIGVDWMTMGKNGTWSVGVILLRLLNVPAEVCGKRACSSVLAVINGGKHQSHLTGYMKAICQEVSKHIEGPGDLGVIVEPHPGPGVDGVAPARVEPVRIHGVPVVSIADTRATATLTRGMGHSALKMCYNCNISKPPNPPTEKAPLGYDAPTLQTLPGSNREEYVLIYDVRMKFTHEQIMSRGAPFIHGWSQGEPRVVGCHAQPLLPLLLQHLDARLAHLVPVYHSFMYGLLKHQLEWFMSADGLHIDVRREIVKRGAAIQSPSDLGRDLGDLANRTGWRMEDYKHWYVHFSPIVLRGNLLPEPYRGLWTALEGACLHYLTPGSENSATPEGMAAGYAHLKTYAARLERCRRDPLLPAAHGDNKDKLSVPTDQVCPNLHTTACRLYMQESNVGRTYLFGELWIERDLHDLKSITTSGIPGAQLDAHIAMRVAGHNASKRLLDRAEPEAQQDYKARLKDELTQEGQQALLLGAGSAECPLQNSPGAMMRGCMKAVQDLQKSDEATPWRPWHVKQVFGEALNAREAEEEAKEAPRVAAPPYPVRYYQRADCNGTIVFSSVYKRPSTRNNTWVSIPFRLDDDKWAIWAGHVQFWVRLEHPKLPGVFLRLAVSRIYLTRPTSHPSCLAATGQAVPRPQQAAAGAAANAGGQGGGEPPGDGDADGGAGPSGIGGPQQHRSAKRGVEQAAAEAASTGGTRKSQRLAAGASQRQADPLPPVEDRPQQSAMGSMHQGYGDEHWYMFDATKIFTVFVTSFEDGEGYGRIKHAQSQFVEVMRDAANSPGMGISQLWQSLSKQPITALEISEYGKLAELAMVMVPGSVEEERMFSARHTSRMTHAKGSMKST
ncbi:hypothetical protein QJQ45_029289 [Haematococcus lacustris]|nr:hypothetical protein QJQ45_029289 [Haematococcus lacustris]